MQPARAASGKRAAPEARPSAANASTLPPPPPPPPPPHSRNTRQRKDAALPAPAGGMPSSGLQLAGEQLMQQQGAAGRGAAAVVAEQPKSPGAAALRRQQPALQQQAAAPAGTDCKQAGSMSHAQQLLPVHESPVSAAAAAGAGVPPHTGGSTQQQATTAPQQKQQQQPQREQQQAGQHQPQQQQAQDCQQHAAPPPQQQQQTQTQHEHNTRQRGREAAGRKVSFAPGPWSDKFSTHDGHPDHEGQLARQRRAGGSGGGGGWGRDLTPSAVRAVEAELGEECRPSIDRLKRRWVLRHAAAWIIDKVGMAVEPGACWFAVCTRSSFLQAGCVSELPLSCCCMPDHACKPFLPACLQGGPAAAAQAPARVLRSHKRRQRGRQPAVRCSGRRLCSQWWRGHRQRGAAAQEAAGRAAACWALSASSAAAAAAEAPLSACTSVYLCRACPSCISSCSIPPLMFALLCFLCLSYPCSYPVHFTLSTVLPHSFFHSATHTNCGMASARSCNIQSATDPVKLCTTGSGAEASRLGSLLTSQAVQASPAPAGWVSAVSAGCILFQLYLGATSAKARCQRPRECPGDCLHPSRAEHDRNRSVPWCQQCL